MNREPEPELMNRAEQVEAYSSADFSLGETSFINFIINYLDINRITLSHNDLIVDLGCGPGNISEKLSNKWPNVNVLGIDGSLEMIKKAESKKYKTNINNRYRNLSYLCEDVRDINIDKIFFGKKISMLVSNSFIHHINQIDHFFDFIIKLSSPDTINFHKDLRRPKDKKAALNLKTKCADKFCDILTKDYYASLKAAYRKTELQEKIFEFNLTSMDVIDESEEYLIVYGKV